MSNAARSKAYRIAYPDRKKEQNARYYAANQANLLRVRREKYAATQEAKILAGELPPKKLRQTREQVNARAREQYAAKKEEVSLIRLTKGSQ